MAGAGKVLSDNGDSAALLLPPGCTGYSTDIGREK
jgi:hypothetical protein